MSDWFAVTQDRIHQFSAATEDHQWIHDDPERARRESPYGAPIAHGFLTLSLIGHLAQQTFLVQRARMLVNYGLNRVRFPAAVSAESRIRARFEVQSVKDFDGGVEATMLVTVECEGVAKPCCVAEWLTRYYS